MKTRRNFTTALLLSCAAALALPTLTGCSALGYRLGSMLPPDLKNLYVPTFDNQTNEPLIEIDASRETIAQIQRDGSFKIVGEDSADAVLTVTLRRYTLHPIAYDRERRLLANEYRVIITASYVLTNARTGAVISEHPGVSGEAQIQVSGSLTQAKEDGLRPAARDLGHQIVKRVVETW